jgi:hypothetical protein
MLQHPAWKTLAVLAATLAIPYMAANAQENPFTPEDAADAAIGVDSAAPAKSLLSIDDPFVARLIGGEPTTPMAQVQAILQLKRLGRLDLAGPIVDALGAKPLSRDEAIAIGQQIDILPLLPVTLSDRLSEAQRKVIADVLSSIGQASTASEPIKAAIGQLSSSDADTVLSARRIVAAGGDVAIGLVATELASEQPRSSQAALLRELRRGGRNGAAAVAAMMGPDAAPLAQARGMKAIAALDPSIGIAELLRASLASDVPAEVAGAAASTLQVWNKGRMPTSAEATAFLQRDIQRSIDTIVAGRDLGDDVMVWVLGKDGTSIQPMLTDPRSALALDAFRKGRALRAIGGTDSQRQLALLAQTMYVALAYDALPVDEQGKLQAIGTQQEWDGALGLAIDRQWWFAALGAIAQMQAHGDATLVDGKHGKPSSLVRAVTEGPPTVRFDAAQAIASLAPTQAYIGNSQVFDAWMQMAKLSDRRRAVVMGRDRTEAVQLARWTSSLGFQSEEVVVCKSLLESLNADPFIELLVIPGQPIDCGLTELVDRIRRTVNGRAVPILIDGADDLLAREALERWPGAARNVPGPSEAVRTDIDRVSRGIPLVGTLDELRELQRIVTLMRIEQDAGHITNGTLVSLEQVERKFDSAIRDTLAFQAEQNLPEGLEGLPPLVVELRRQLDDGTISDATLKKLEAYVQGLIDQRDGNLLSVRGIRSAATIAYQASQLERTTSLPLLTQSDRQRYVAAGSVALAAIAGDRNRYRHYDLLQRDGDLMSAIGKAGFTAEAFQVWSAMGTVGSQQLLIEMAGNNQLPSAARRQAGSALAASIARFGTRLTQDEVVLQYDRYNASADPETRAALSVVLDAIEKRAGVPLSRPVDGPSPTAP